MFTDPFADRSWPSDNQQHPKSDGSYQTCKFFNGYILSKNAVPQGLYCSLYGQVW